MGTFSMDMSSYEIERREAMASGYSDEVLCAGWVPVLAMHQVRPHDCNNRPAIPDDLMVLDVDLFLHKMYACQR